MFQVCQCKSNILVWSRFRPVFGPLSKGWRSCWWLLLCLRMSPREQPGNEIGEKEGREEKGFSTTLEGVFWGVEWVELFAGSLFYFFWSFWLGMRLWLGLGKCCWIPSVPFFLNRMWFPLLQAVLYVFFLLFLGGVLMILWRVHPLLLLEGWFAW